MPPISEATFLARDHLIYPYSHDGKPVVISPTDYGLNYKPTRSEKFKSFWRKRWFSIRKWIHQEAVWLHELGGIYQEGFYRSTIPSADVLASPRREPVRKLLWCAVLTPLIYLTISDLKDVIEGYMKYPVIYTYEYKTNDTLVFPDVTICNANPFLKSKACKNDSILWKRKHIEVNGERYEIQPFCIDRRQTMCQRLCDENETATEPNINDTEIRSEFAIWMKETIALGELASQEVANLGHQVENAVKKCSYASNDDCSRDFTRFTKTTSQLYGSCFCFHCQTRSNQTEDRELLRAEREAMEIKERDWAKYYEYGTLSSPLSGLVIQLNTEIHEYLPISYEVGFIAMIHEHNKDYSVCQDAIYILPGYTTYIGLNLATTHNLEEPYEDGCRNSWPPDLKNGKLNANVYVMEISVEHLQYNRAMCLEYCEIEYLIYKCKCIKNDPAVKVHPDLVEDYKYCKTPRKEKCANDETQNKTNVFWQARCDCRRECETLRYGTDVSVAGFITEETSNDTDKNYTEVLTADMRSARLVVYFHSFTYEHVKAITKYDDIRVLSNIGGINGMYLGLSFYLLFQALDILFIGAIRFIKAIRERKFAFAQDGNMMSSVGIQTSARGERRNRNTVRPSYASVASQSPTVLPEMSLYGGSRKNIWDVFEKPSGKGPFNTTEQFDSKYGPIEIQYYKNGSR